MFGLKVINNEFNQTSFIPILICMLKLLLNSDQIITIEK